MSRGCEPLSGRGGAGLPAAGPASRTWGRRPGHGAEHVSGMGEKEAPEGRWDPGAARGLVGQSEAGRGLADLMVIGSPSHVSVPVPEEVQRSSTESAAST